MRWPPDGMRAKQATEKGPYTVCPATAPLYLSKPTSKPIP